MVLAFGSCKKKETPIIPPNETDVELDVKVLASGFSHPWEIAWGPDNHLWLTERGGKISQVDPVSGTKKLIFTIPDVRSIGEGGLLGMALHPAFSSSPHVFVVYNYDKAGNYTEKVVRYTYNGTTLTSPVTIIDNIAGGNIHNGSRLAISPDLKLYITTGDAGNGPLAQNVNSVNGKVLRLNLDGSIPADNPTAGNAMWTWGHRNAQGLVFANGRLYSSEHGPNADDEINIITKGRNYGWPNVEGKCNSGGELPFCGTNNVMEPIMTWTPTIAPSGMEYYNND
ncbi:MAG: PQQ-dependent sugar dehydrogenase, partial [Pedobacter sp.]